MSIIIMTMAGILGGVVLYPLAVSLSVSFVCGPCRAAAAWLNEHDGERSACYVMLFGLKLIAFVDGGLDTPAVHLQERFRKRIENLENT
jgi:hypothetical protein